MNLNLNSGYAEITTFAVSGNSLSAYNVDWGDGTYSKSFPHYHEYADSGNYTVQIVGCAALSGVVIEEEICVSDIIQPKLEVITDPLTSFVGCGATFEVCVSSLDPNITLHFYASGSDSNPYTEPEGFWDHLKPRWRFLDEDDNYIATATFSGTPIDVSSNTVAYSGCYTFKYIDDMPNTPIVFVTMETPNSNSRIYSGLEHTVSALEPNSICITEDGIRDIYDIQWAGIPIPYVVSFCNTTNDCSTILHYISGSVTDSKLTGMCTNINQTISSYDVNLYDENCFNVGGYILTSVTVPVSDIPSVSSYNVVEDACSKTGEVTYETVRLPSYNAIISASATVSYGGDVYEIEGQSNSFTLYPFQEYHKFRRQGESEDLGEKLQYYAFTDRMRNHNTLWEYADAIMGAGLDTLGSRSYFGIDRFADQHSDLDRCNLNALLDMSQKYDVNVDDYALDTPYNVKRIMDMVSMPLEKVVGTRCVCNTNFAQCESCCGANVCGLCGFDKTTNIGDAITNSEYVTAGEDILYKEEAGEVYEIVHVLQQDGEDVFKINTLSADCVNERNDLCFYRWDKTQQNNPIESEIDYNSELTTIDHTLSTAEDWYGDGGIVEELLNYELIKGLGLDE